MTLQATRHQAPDEATALELFHMREWTDGLPVVIPTEERVVALLAGVELEPDVIIGKIGPSQASVEKIAINAVMAGCRPEHFPVVLAAVRAVGDSEFDIDNMQSTTHGMGPVVIVNGPAREVCGPIASGWGALGPGHRANASIGRALRLCLMNIGGARPGHGDMAALGQPGKFTCCLAEDEEGSPFTPLHTAFGYDADQSAVTLVGVDAPHSVMMQTNDDDPEAHERILRVVAGSIAIPGGNNTQIGNGPVIVVLNPIHAGVLANAGLSREDVCERLTKLAVTPNAVMRGWATKRRIPEGDGDLPALRGPEDIVLIVAGGGGMYSAVFSGGLAGSTHPVHAPIDFDFSCELPGLPPT
ncbi:MAG: hypothetical protein OXD50_07525 [Chloroflexi bacterium]|nr:hypothetical protein [Chloroflexota bacterium]